MIQLNKLKIGNFTLEFKGPKFLSRSQFNRSSGLKIRDRVNSKFIVFRYTDDIKNPYLYDITYPSNIKFEEFIIYPQMYNYTQYFLTLLSTAYNLEFLFPHNFHIMTSNENLPTLKITCSSINQTEDQILSIMTYNTLSH